MLSAIVINDRSRFSLPPKPGGKAPERVVLGREVSKGMCPSAVPEIPNTMPDILCESAVTLEIIISPKTLPSSANPIFCGNEIFKVLWNLISAGAGGDTGSEGCLDSLDIPSESGHFLLKSLSGFNLTRN